MGLHKDPMLDKAIAMAFNSGDFAAAWRACGKPGTWRNADRQWKASMKKQQEQQQASAAQQQEQAAAAHQTPLHGKAPAAASTRTAASTGAPTQGRTGELKAPVIRHSSAQTAKIKASSDAFWNEYKSAHKAGAGQRQGQGHGLAAGHLADDGGPARGAARGAGRGGRRRRVKRERERRAARYHTVHVTDCES